MNLIGHFHDFAALLLSRKKADNDKRNVNNPTKFYNWKFFVFEENNNIN